MIDKCKICGEYIWGENHICGESWLCRRVDGDEWDEAFGEDPNLAIERYCEKHFADWEYPKSIEVEICKDEDSQIYIYDVEVEAIPSFCATLRKEI
jgi:hypothetical protein